MPVVAAINLTPVKSTALRSPDRIELRREGALGDRRFLFARLDGSRPSGVSKAPLMRLRTSWDRDAERLSVASLDGTTLEGDARPLGEPTDVALYDRTVRARRIDPVFDELTAAFDQTLALLRVDEPEYAGGDRRVSVISRASVADVGARANEPRLDPRRFRMLLEIDGLDPYEEDGWRGRRIAVGGAVIELDQQMPRCVMTTLDPDTGVQDVDTLGALAQHRREGTRLLLGISGQVVTPGAVAVGDDARPAG